MAVFSDLYGELLDIELGTADRTQRFTTARRKAAINRGVQHFIRLTSCFVIEHSEALVDEQQEYDLGAVITSDKFFKLADQQPYIKQTTSGGVVTYIDGDSFVRRSVNWLDRHEPGWRNASSGTPQYWYVRETAENVYFGLYPKPNEPSGDTHLLQIPYVAYPADMTADGSIPFATTEGGAAKDYLRAYHQALVHYAAAELEKLRKNYQVAGAQFEAFIAYTEDYLASRRPTGGDQVSFSHSYLGRADNAFGMARAPDWRR